MVAAHPRVARMVAAHKRAARMVAAHPRAARMVAAHPRATWMVAAQCCHMESLQHCNCCYCQAALTPRLGPGPGAGEGFMMQLAAV